MSALLFCNLESCSELAEDSTDLSEATNLPLEPSDSGFVEPADTVVDADPVADAPASPREPSETDSEPLQNTKEAGFNLSIPILLIRKKISLIKNKEVLAVTSWNGLKKLRIDLINCRIKGKVLRLLLNKLT